MVSREEREKDKAICEAASTDWREGAVEKWHLYCAATHPDRMAHERVLMRANEHFPYEADVKAAAHCRNRLPLYIADAEEMDKRFAEVEALIRRREEKASEFERAGELTSATILRDRANGARDALRILRGEK